MDKDEDKKKLNEVAERIVYFDNGGEVKYIDEEFMVVLTGYDWKQEVRFSLFGVRDVEIKDRVVFEFLALSKTWILKLDNGYASVDRMNIDVGNPVTLRDGSSIRVGNTQFLFSLPNKMDKFQKSYKQIIIEAIKASTSGKLSLAGIYRYFEITYGFPLEDSTKWKNSIRHNLSVNTIFKRVPRDEKPFSVKGMLWTVVDNLDEKEREADTNNVIDYKNIGEKHRLVSKVCCEQEHVDWHSVCEEKAVQNKRKVSEDGYPNKRFKKTVVPRATCYVSVPVSYSFEHLLTRAERARIEGRENLPDVSYDVPDFSSECSSDIFSWGGGGDSDRQALSGQKSLGDILDMDENDNIRKPRHQRRSRRPFN